MTLHKLSLVGVESQSRPGESGGEGDLGRKEKQSRRGYKLLQNLFFRHPEERE
jgi:hypothetical protein